jgi:hypothetical protein
MEIETALQAYLIDLKESAPRERVEFDLTVLARLQEHLLANKTSDDACAVSGADLLAFIRDWYREGEDVTPVVAHGLVGAVQGWARWLDEQPDSSLAVPRVLSLAGLEEQLPRALRAAEALQRHARREDLGEAIPVEEAAGGSPLGTISAGLTRVVRPEEVDYDRAEEDTFELVELGERSMALLSPVRAQLNEGPAAPVNVPARAVRLLRVGDILHLEIAPTAAGWEILNVEAVYPGGLDDRP